MQRAPNMWDMWVFCTGLLPLLLRSRVRLCRFAALALFSLVAPRVSARDSYFFSRRSRVPYSVRQLLTLFFPPPIISCTLNVFGFSQFIYFPVNPPRLLVQNFCNRFSCRSSVALLRFDPELVSFLFIWEVVVGTLFRQLSSSFFTWQRCVISQTDRMQDVQDLRLRPFCVTGDPLCRNGSCSYLRTAAEPSRP